MQNPFIDNADLRGLESKAVIEEIKLPFNGSGVKVFIKRLDLIHPWISGNKWYKLKYNIAEAVIEGYDRFLTFGGAYSNHIYSASAAGKLAGFKSIGIIRGEQHLPLNPTLYFASSMGMELHYLDRTTYRKRNDAAFQENLKSKFGNIFIVPEGGTNLLAVKGCAEIINSIDIDYDFICTPAGTGGTTAGLVAGLNGNKNVLSFSVLRGGEFLYNEIEKLVELYSGKKFDNWKLLTEYHFGGYAKINWELIEFLQEFEKQNGFALDPVYTGKMMYAIFDLIKKGYFKKGTVIVVLHTGGLQGIEGMQDKIDNIISLHYKIK